MLSRDELAGMHRAVKAACASHHWGPRSEGHSLLGVIAGCLGSWPPKPGKLADIQTRYGRLVYRNSDRHRHTGYPEDRRAGTGETPGAAGRGGVRAGDVRLSLRARGSGLPLVLDALLARV